MFVNNHGDGVILCIYIYIVIFGGFRNAHGHNLRDIFINDALCSQIETIIVWVIIRGRRIVDDIIKCDCD